MMVDFFICGVQKGGTTALDSFLRQHPQIQMANTKETHFFDDDSITWSAPKYTKLYDFFDATKTTLLRGEATPIYTYWPNAIERLHAYNPSAKLILMLRHPVYRALSHWRMEATRGWDTLPFSEAVSEMGRGRVRSAPGGVHRIYSYVERGFYFPQLSRIRGLFPDNQILILRTDTLWNSLAETLSQIQSFLGVIPLITAERRYIVPIISDRSTSIAPREARYLSMVYEEDIRQTQRLTGLELLDWLDPAYAEPMRS